MDERTNQVVKLRRELLCLEQLRLLVGEARVLVSGRPLRKKNGESARPFPVTDPTTPNSDEETKRETDRSRQRVAQLTRKKPPDIFADAEAAAAAGGRRRPGSAGAARVTRVRRRLRVTLG